MGQQAGGHVDEANDRRPDADIAAEIRRNRVWSATQDVQRSEEERSTEQGEADVGTGYGETGDKSLVVEECRKKRERPSADACER